MEVGFAARLTGALVAAALLAWFAALVIGLASGSEATAIVVRTVLVLAVLVIATRVLVRRSTAAPGLARGVLASAVLSYAVFPATWVGRSLLTQLLVAPGVVTVLLDGCFWVGTVVLASRSVQPRPAPVGYGSHG